MSCRNNIMLRLLIWLTIQILLMFHMAYWGVSGLKHQLAKMKSISVTESLVSLFLFKCIDHWKCESWWIDWMLQFLITSFNLPVKVTCSFRKVWYISGREHLQWRGTRDACCRAWICATVDRRTRWRWLMNWHERSLYLCAEFPYTQTRNS